MATRVLYVNPLALGGNPAIDAIAYGLQHTLHAAGIELRVLFADFTAPDYRRQYEDAITAGIAARVEAIVVYVITPSAFHEPVAKRDQFGRVVFLLIEKMSHQRGFRKTLSIVARPVNTRAKISDQIERFSLVDHVVMVGAARQIQRDTLFFQPIEQRSRAAHQVLVGRRGS